MNQDNRLFLKGFILLLTTGFWVANSFSVSYAKDKINVDLIGKWGYSGSILTVEILHNTHTDHYQYAYCGTSNGLLIFDVSDQNMPKKIVFFEIGKVNDIEFFIDDEKNKYAALVGEKGLGIYDISDPIKPTYTGGYKTAMEAQGIAIHDQYSYVTYYKNVLVIIDISDPKAPKYAGGYDSSGEVGGIAILDQYALVADGSNGLVIIDISNPTDPIYAGGYATGYCRDIAVQDHYAFVADGFNGLVIIDISNPTNLIYAGGYDTVGAAYDLVIQGHYAFVADGDTGLVIIDVSNHTEPKYAGGYHTTGNSKGITIQGNYAFVANDYNGLVIIDISDPIGLTYTGGYPIEVKAQGIAVQDQYAFVGDNNDLVIIDISDPKDPKDAGRYNTAGYAYGIAIKDYHAFVTAGGNGLVIIDISDPTRPKYTGRYNTAGYAYGIAIKDNYAFVADRDRGLIIIDITDPTDPKYAGEYDTAGYAYSIAIKDNYTFVADGYKGLVIIDISDPTHPKYAGEYDTGWSAYDIAIQDNYAFVAAGENGPVIIDITDPIEPKYVSGDSTWYAWDIAVQDNFAFVADRNRGLIIIDITDPADTKYAGGYHTTGRSYGIAIQGQYAFLTDDNNGLVIIDITDPRGPIYTGDYDTAVTAYDIVIQNNYAFVAGYQKGLIIIDITDPISPKYVSGYDTIGLASGIAIQDQYAFVADGYNGLVIIDITDLTDPKYSSRYFTGYAFDITIQDNYASVVDDDNGLVFINITDPTNPKDAGGYAPINEWLFYNTLQLTGDIAIMDNYAFVAEGQKGNLMVIDVIDPTDPRHVSVYDTAGWARCIAIQDHYAFVADWDNGIVILDISDPVHPKYAGGYDTAGLAEGIAIRDQYAFLADENNGILVFHLTKAPQSQGNLILCPGGPSSDKNILWSPYQALANKTYLTFTGHNYPHYFTYYLTPTLYQDTNGDGIFDLFDADDSDPTVEDMEYAITDWAYNRLSTGPLYICLMGHGAEDRFQIMPNEVISAQELKKYIEKFQNGYIDNKGAYHPGTDRPVVVIIESGASGSFINDLVSPSNHPHTDDIIVITSTGSEPSHIKPSPDPDTDIPISFMSFIMDSLQNDSSIEDYQDSLKEAFIFSREQIYQTGHPFLDQAPQMYLPEGPISITFTLDDPNTSVDPLIINQKEEKIALRVVARYPDGTTMTLDPGHLHFLSSQPLVFDTNDPNQMKITSDQILILPEKNSLRNGLATFIAYPDPSYYPNILLTARLPLEVSIQENTPAGGNKAIIVAGYRTSVQGEPDSLWDNTNTIANHAYKSLRKKGFGREDIFYLNPHFFQDIDDNQRFDDIDRHPTVENLKWAFDNIEETGAQELLIFLVDHGEIGHFNISLCCQDLEGLSSQVLGDAILSVAPMVKGHINILIDACHSGSFTLPEDRLFQEKGEDPNNVILITSSKEDEKAYFLSDGMVSFSYPFFDQYFITNSLKDAFDYARFTIPSSGQTPLLWTQGRARERDKQLVYFVDDACPIITQTEFSRREGKLSFLARVYSLSGIKRVWALILSSDQAPSLTEASPEIDAPFINLSPDDPNTPYGGRYSAGEVDDPYPDAYNYQVLLCAQDKNDKITTYRANISNQKRDAIGVIILVTDPDVTEMITDPKISEEDKADLINLFDYESNHVYQVLKDKEIKDDDIYYLKVPGGYREVVDADPDLAAVRAGIPSWLEGKEYDILLICLLGQGQEPPYASFCLNQNEYISPKEFGSYIHPKEGCRVIFFCDISYARAFIEGLPFDDYWTGIASTESQNCFKSNEGFLSLFSNLFFSKISSITLGRAYEEAKITAYNYYHIEHRWHQITSVHSLDTFGNIKELGSMLKIIERLNFHIGSPSASREDSRLIKTLRAWEDGDNIKLEIKVKESVIIRPPKAGFIIPSGSSISVSLVQDTKDPSLWRFIQKKDQCYTRVSIRVQQIDESGRVIDSEWSELDITRSIQGSEADTYEEDDEPGQAWPIVVSNRAQLHTFHNPNDTDWVYFFGHKGHQYDMRANDGMTCRFIKLSLSDPNGKILTTEAGIPIQSPFCSLRWQCSKDGYYYLNVEPASEYPPDGIGYTLSVEYVQADLSPIRGRAAIIGRVIDSKQKGVNGVWVNLISSGQIMRKTWTGSIQNLPKNNLDQSKLDGWYFIPNIDSGVYDFTFTGDDPNVILKRVLEISLSLDQIKRVEDVVLELSENRMDVVSEFDLVYTQYQKAKCKDYPVWEDKDKDYISNLEEFLDGTDPDSPDNALNITLDMILPEGWSMISIPLLPEIASISELFPDAKVVYAYKKDSGYERVKETEELEVGRGYWILLNKEKIYTLTGRPVYPYTLSVNEEGWEMIGGCTYAARALTDSCNIGVIYRYNQEGGYVRVDNLEDLEPGEGYWILLNHIVDQCELRVERN